MRSVHRFVLPSFVLALVSCATPVATGELTLIEALAPRIEGHLSFLASDAMGGRDTGTVQDGITAEYVASVFRAAGLAPAGDDGGYFARYPLVASQLDLASVTLAFDGIEHDPIVPGQDFAVRGFGARGFDLSGPVVFAGFGIVDEAAGVDDYAQLDADGKFVLTFAGSPDGRDDLRTAANWRRKSEEARRQGALGEIVILGDDDRSFAWMAGGMGGRSMALGGVELEAAEAPFPRIVLKPHAAIALLASAGHELETLRAAYVSGASSGGFELSGITATARAAVLVQEIVSANVAAVLPGGDPALSHEYVLLTAHMDHVGANAEGDVYNGADDNASGTATVMAVAEHLAASAHRPRRSVLFLTVSGEEKGLLGSEWWSRHPTVELRDVVANINMDMVGRNDPMSIGVTPSADHPDYNGMVARALELGPLVGLEVGFHAGEGDFRRKVDDYYQRSDHVHFAKLGIPVAFFFAGEHEDYHQVTDTLDKLDRSKILKVVDLVTRLVRDVADADERPRLLGQ